MRDGVLIRYALRYVYREMHKELERNPPDMSKYADPDPDLEKGPDAGVTLSNAGAPSQKAY